MWYQIEDFPKIDSCVYKLWYAGKYVIVKCKTVFRSVQNINIGLKYFYLNTEKGRKEEDYFHEFFVHVFDNPFQSFTFEIIKQSNNPLDLLKSEYFELARAKYDPRCLNQSFDVYIPKNTQRNGKKSWINRGYYLNFMQWKRKQNQSKYD